MGLLSWIKAIIPSKEPIDNDFNKTKFFKNTWTLEEFSKAHGKMQLLDVFGRCQFVGAKTITTVYMSKETRNYTKQQIEQEKDNLFIKRFEDSGNYCLCKKWEDVEL